MLFCLQMWVKWPCVVIMLMISWIRIIFLYQYLVLSCILGIILFSSDLLFIFFYHCVDLAVSDFVYINISWNPEILFCSNAGMYFMQEPVLCVLCCLSYNKINFNTVNQAIIKFWVWGTCLCNDNCNYTASLHFIYFTNLMITWLGPKHIAILQKKMLLLLY